MTSNWGDDNTMLVSQSGRCANYRYSFSNFKTKADKAAFLSKEPNYVMKMPTGSNDLPTFMVPSNSSEYPHKVMAFPNSGKPSCGQSCTGWKLYSLCSHNCSGGNVEAIEGISNVVQEKEEFSQPYSACKH